MAIFDRVYKTTMFPVVEGRAVSCVTYGSGYVTATRDVPEVISIASGVTPSYMNNLDTRFLNDPSGWSQ